MPLKIPETMVRGRRPAGVTSRFALDSNRGWCSQGNVGGYFTAKSMACRLLPHRRSAHPNPATDIQESFSVQWPTPKFYQHELRDSVGSTAAVTLEVTLRLLIIELFFRSTILIAARHIHYVD